MSKDVKPSAEWTPKNVLKRLRKATASGKPASANFFVTEAVSPDQLQEKAKQIVEDASASLGLAAGAVKLGKVHPLAKSFSVTASAPEVFEEIMKCDEVKTVLESAQEDIYPKPVGRKVVP